jgi:DNA polymerase III epsilon subunit family exonuclease
MSQIAVVDVETTGLFPQRHDRLVEIAIVVLNQDGDTEREYQTLVNPERDMGPTALHGISAGEVLHAPKFAEIAADILEFLNGVRVLAGHNVRFDRGFLDSEFQRINVTLPEGESICTCQLLGGSSLAACCAEYGITFDGEPHCAIHDARATANLLRRLFEDEAELQEKCRQALPVQWPSFAGSRAKPVTRGEACEKTNQPPGYLQRLVSTIRHNSETSSADVVAYLALVDRVLEDRRIDEKEGKALLETADQWGISGAEIITAHRSYVHSLAIRALADGVVTDSERSDLHQVARLLGYEKTELDLVLNKAAMQLQSLASPKTHRAESTSSASLIGKSVCFTGELKARLNGEPISRDMAECLAEKAGMKVASGVTKKLDFLVVADPNTQSGKAKKARDYGIRILADSVFWQLAGINVD